MLKLQYTKFVTRKINNTTSDKKKKTYIDATISYMTQAETKRQNNNKQLLDEVFVISRRIKVEVISRSRRLRLITLIETLIIMDITKTESNNCFIIHRTEQKNLVFVLLH